MIVMRAKDAVKRLRELASPNMDPEEAHMEADGILLEFVPKSVADAWRTVEKWYA